MGASSVTAVAQPLDPTDIDLPEATQDILEKGKRSWLKNTEVCDMLINYAAFNLRVAREPPCKPPGGSLFLFDRKAVRFFRKDNHNWRKKADGKTVRETHEKLKVGNVDMLNCYYAHADRQDGLQRRCYWLLESEDDIVLVHYLNIAQRQQAGRASKRITNEETASQPKSDDKDSSSHSDPETSPASDTEYATTQGMPSPAEQHQHAGHAAAAGIHAAAPPSGLLAAAEPYMPLLPSMSMDGFFAQIDGKLSSDKLGLDEPLRSNVAVQELLHTWEAEQHNVDPSALFSTSAHWQKGGLNTVKRSPELQHHLADASHSLRMIEDMHQGSNSKWMADEQPPRPNPFPHHLHDSKSCTHSTAFLHSAPGALGQASTSPHLQQLQPPLPPKQRSPPSNRFLTQTHSAPATGAVDYLTGLRVAGASAHLPPARQPAFDGVSPEGLDGNQLADFVGLSKSANTFGQLSEHWSHQHALDSGLPTCSFPPSGFQQSCQQGSFSSQLPGSFSTASSMGQSSQTAFTQSGSFAVPRSLARPRAMVQNAFTSQPGLSSGLRFRPQSPFGMSPGLSPEPSEALLQPQSAFNLPLQSSLAAALRKLPRAPAGQRQMDPAAHQASPYGQPEASSAPSLPFRSTPYGSNTAMLGTSPNLPPETLPSEATSMDICSSQGLSAPSRPPATLRRRASAGVSEQASHDQAQPPLSWCGEFGQQDILPIGTTAPSPFAPNTADPTPEASLGQPQSLGLHQETLHPNGMTEDSHNSGTSADLQAEPDSMRKAALVLNAQLAKIDKQVLEHIVPRCGHAGRADSHQSECYIVAQQVQQCEEQLRELEASSQQLLQASAEQAVTLTRISSGVLSQGEDSSRGQTGTSSASRPPGKRKMVRRLSDTGSSNYPLFDVLECGPAWDFTLGGTKVLIVANGLDEKQMKEACGHLHVMFDRTEVDATVMWPGVMRCTAPPHAPGSVRLCLTLGNARPCSKAVTFEYKIAASPPSSVPPRPSAGLTDRDLQLQLLQALLQGHPAPSSTPQNPSTRPTSAVPRSGPVTGMGPMTGLLLEGNPGASLNRGQLLQALFKLEIESQTPKAEPLHGSSSQAEGPQGPLSSPAALNSLSEQGLSPLHLVAGLGYNWACTSLINMGASVHLQDASGLTALHWAASRGREACVTSLLLKGSDPSCLTHTSDSNPGRTAADLASSAGHSGIAAFLSEASLVYALSKAQTGKPPASLVSLLDWHSFQQHSAASLPSDPSFQRKRCRTDQRMHEGALLPASQLISSARDPMAPNVNIIVRLSTAAPQQNAETASGDRAGSHMTQRPPHSLAGQSRGFAGPYQTGPTQSRGVEERGPAAMAAVAKQAVAVLERQWQRQDGQASTSGVRRAQRKQRDEVALQRVTDSTKMWSTLRKIAEAELADSTSQAADSVTLRFLSLVPRVERLNDAVRFGLASGRSGEAAGEADGAAEVTAGEESGEPGDVHPSGVPPQSPCRTHTMPPKTVKLAAEELPDLAGPDVADTSPKQVLNQAVQYIEAMVGRSEAYAQYERLMRAAKSATFRPPARRVMPALHSY